MKCNIVSYGITRANLTRDNLCCLLNILYQSLICREELRSYSWHLTNLIAQWCDIYIMEYRILRYHDITDIDSCIQRTCYTRIDYMSDIKEVAEDLYTDTCIYLTDTTLYNDHILAIQLTLVEFHRCLLYYTRDFHICLQLCYFYVHCSDNSDFHFFFLY